MSEAEIFAITPGNTDDLAALMPGKGDGGNHRRILARCIAAGWIEKLTDWAEQEALGREHPFDVIVMLHRAQISVLANVIANMVKPSPVDRDLVAYLHKDFADLEKNLAATRALHAKACRNEAATAARASSPAPSGGQPSAGGDTAVRTEP